MADGAGAGSAGDDAWRPGAADRCYRHRDEVSFVLCQRCGRTVCGRCQTQAPVGVICPECMAEARRAAPRAVAPSKAASGARRLAAGSATTWLLGAIAAVSAVQLLVSTALGRDLIGDVLDFSPIHVAAFGSAFQPWRELTYALVHGSILHLLFNLVTLWFFGRAVEGVIGRRRMLLLFAASVLGGAAAVAMLAPFSAVIGASAGIYGLMAAAFFVMRRTGESTRTLLVLIAINLVFGFIGSGVSWQAHLGGLAVGALLGWLLVRDADRAPARKVGVGEIAAWAVTAVLLAAPAAITLLSYRTSLTGI